MIDRYYLDIAWMKPLLSKRSGAATSKIDAAWYVGTISWRGH